MTTLRQVVNVVETLYPLRYAESWDAPGLIVGEPGADVGLVAFAADPTMAVIDEAIERGADLLICHHPLLFRSVHAVSGQDVHGAIVGKLYSHHCALWVGHTNADAAWRGVGQAAADAFGLVDQRPLVPIDDPGSAHAVGLGRVGLLEEPIDPWSVSRIAWAQRCRPRILVFRSPATSSRSCGASRCCRDRGTRCSTRCGPAEPMCM